MILERMNRQRFEGCREEEVLGDYLNPNVGLIWFGLDFGAEGKRSGFVTK